MNFNFLKSNRFWFVGLASLFWFLQQMNLLPSELAVPLIMWALASAGIRTIDRFGEKIGNNQ